MFEGAILILAVGAAISWIIKAVDSNESTSADETGTPLDKWELIWKLGKEVDELEDDLIFNEGDTGACATIQRKIDFKQEMARTLAIQIEE